MSEYARDVDAIREAGAYESEEAVLEDAIRALLRRRPELRVELAVAKYRDGSVSRNRAAEIAGLSPASFAEELAERGITKPIGFLSDAERDARLREH